MSLSCSCDFDPEPGNIVWYAPLDYSELSTPKRKRCCSCESLIDLGAVSARFERYKIAETEIEENIHGEEVPRAAWYMCEECADLYFSLTELGFCFFIGDNMRELAQEYAAMQVA